MGMDLIALSPQDPEQSSIHFNWSGWSVFADLLTELGCNTEEMSGSNDGELVAAETATAWAAALESQMNRIVAVRYPDDRYYGGYRTELKVTGTTTPVLISSAEAARAVIAELVAERNSSEQARIDDALHDKDADEAPDAVPVSEDEENYEWLLGIISFLRGSGGFAQY